LRHFVVINGWCSSLTGTLIVETTMTRLKFILPLVAAVAAWPAAAQDQANVKSAGAEVSIPFVNFGGIDDWRADGNQALYIKGRGGDDWYYARLFAPCHDLPFVDTIGFENEATGSLDKFSAIVVRGQKCQLTSLVKSAKPAARK
jgi:hypothetical protein